MVKKVINAMAFVVGLWLGSQLALSCARADDAGFSFDQEDKVLHFGLSTMGSLVMTTAATGITKDKTKGFLIGAGTMMAIGVAKELSDDRFSIGDIKADLLGCLLGAATASLAIKF